MYSICRCVVLNANTKKAIWDNWRRNAGHSKWQNIKHIKALKDSQKSAVFTKMSRLIRVAVQEGKSADPEHNVQLAQVVERARKNNMPVASIENAIKAAQNSKVASKPGLIELKGPAGSLMLVSVLTDNLAKTRTELLTIIKKTRATVSDGGGRMFEHKGVFEVTPPAGVGFDVAEEHAIEVGAEEVHQLDGDVLQFICAAEQFYAVKKGLQTRLYDIRYAEQEYIPKSQVTPSDDILDELSSVYLKLEQHPDVVRIYDNIA
ncbi:translational activator of cytochrome c oxidase 1 isoform X1 [Schistocerca serialis cubense]|uniref:translational activator of cytochrome c oxidase 1 isoform X1 n=1 Tax=Schistocerca serialis cubense TaxID=2023355 RepID=UPI00214ECAC9|nr:translational activator of cytochrome c oxidase 1 isoform X1 [Schistocerca serialis cubense]